MSSICMQTLIIIVFSILSIWPPKLSSESIITHLPGFDGPLPFYLETGYVTVDEKQGSEFFYYFVESDRNPRDDPLILWLTGGPYCSGLVGLAIDIGPLKFEIKAYDGTLPSLISNPHSWTKISSIIFLDWPVGAGFSFSRNTKSYLTDDVQSVKQIYKFLKKWLLNHPFFLSNPLYVGGDSYGGKMTPLVAVEIIGGNEDLQQPLVNLKGYLVGNPVTGERIDISSEAPQAYRLGIISEEVLELILENCAGQDHLKPQTALCAANLNVLNDFLSEINIYNILVPKCPEDPPTLKELEGACRLLKPKSLEYHSSPSVPATDCANSPLLSYYWSNNNLTTEALHIKKGTVKEWQSCPTNLGTYTYSIPSSVPHHLNLITRGYRALIYSGDHDVKIPSFSTLEWIRSLNLSVIADWHSWRVGGQVAGYTVFFSNNLTFATVKGGSHTSANNMPLQCVTMFERWISHESL